jgi:preprotein translocase subunit SecA
VGRAARQGDPGTFQFFLSLEDELLYCLPPERVADLRRQARPDALGELPAQWLQVFRRTQRLLERLHARQRKSLLKIEQKRIETYERMGLDPYLEMTE